MSPERGILGGGFAGIQFRGLMLVMMVMLPILVPRAARRLGSRPACAVRIIGSRPAFAVRMCAEADDTSISSREPARSATGDGEEDWIKARIAEEDAAFNAKREAARLAKSMTGEEEERILRATEVRDASHEQLSGSKPMCTAPLAPTVAAPSASDTISPLAAECAALADAAAVEEMAAAAWREIAYPSTADSDPEVTPARPSDPEGIREAPATASTSGSSFDEPPEQAIADYEARVRAAARTRPRTEEEKREAYQRDLLAQIEQADAMEERLRQKRRAKSPVARKPHATAHQQHPARQQHSAAHPQHHQQHSAASQEQLTSRQQHLGAWLRQTGIE